MALENLLRFLECFPIISVSIDLTPWYALIFSGSILRYNWGFILLQKEVTSAKDLWKWEASLGPAKLANLSKLYFALCSSWRNLWLSLKKRLAGSSILFIYVHFERDPMQLKQGLEPSHLIFFRLHLSQALQTLFLLSFPIRIKTFV